jgi:peptide/nickel transport system ATP-binding protein
MVVDEHIAGQGADPGVAGIRRVKDPDARVVLEVEALTKSFWIRSGVFGRQAFQAVKGATFRLRAGHTLGVVGEVRVR